MVEIPLSGASDQLTVLLLTFARIGTICMLMPGLGESYVSPRIRLGIAASISLIISVTVAHRLPFLNGFGEVIFAMISEIVAGLIFGGAMRMFLAAPQIAGQMTSQLTSLSNIFASGAPLMEASSILGAWFVVGAILFTFVSGMHYLMIDALAISYNVIPLGGFPNMGDAAEGLVKVFAGVFALGVQMAAPFILLSLIFNLGVGLTNRMLASLPLYFVAMPISILGGMYVLAYAIGPVLAAFRAAFSTWLTAPFS
ncbi:flagellar biosynthetic protein FliR [Parvularcula lutaonensis]|uniref:Flagellar biosynthetic protein FliR n=1 Tax=Parvularcula lutaonensis TaxID=491923 RepID=A0ABV7MCI3_9PROT|nr:flagellar biosynthetic protein FliR [Parvularcula lutaonensis]GGY50903.1 flagellar biosynthetic protein FliR [Parvularcula lutaonensis]